ncbi:MAG: excinuclease ABC subunit UvrC [Candidatus Peribacteraceae bacterium]
MSPQKKTGGNTNLPSLRKRIAKVPESPGVYRWKDKHDTTIYIGKAKNLRNRLRSYVQKENASLGPWKMNMLKHIANFDITVTNNELEALVLETNLIKENKPKYNVLMKDDKSYLYVQISRDPYPIVDIVRRGVADGTIGFGPFTSAYDIRQTIDMLHLVFPYKACRKSLEALNRATEKGEDVGLFDEKSSPCLEQQIGQCCGLCVGAITQEQYRKSIEEIMSFLKGNHAKAKEKLREKMGDAAAQKKFEKAAAYRNALQTIEHMQQKQLASDTSGEDVDIIGIAVTNGNALAVMFRQRNGQVIDDQSFTLAGTAETSAHALEQFITQFYGATPDIPPIIVVGEDLEESALLEKWLSRERGKNVELRTAERGRKSQLLQLAQKNAEEKLKAQETKWEAAAKNIESALEELKEILALPEIPKRIEGYDISHLSGTETVGSMSVCKNGKAANDQYRSFTIRTVKEGEVDDYKALEEVLRRRLLHLIRNVKEEERQWKEREVTFGKARKAEAGILENIIKNDPTLSFLHVNNKDFLVARKEKEIVACARIFDHKDGTRELMSVWVHPNFRGQKLGQFLCRKLLFKEKKKVYAGCRTALNEYYDEIGFQPIRSAPKTLASGVEALEKQLKEPHIVVMYDPKQHKPDTSLTEHPDLLVIDGGKGQLSTAVKVLKELKLEIPVIGLAKREEEVFIPGNSHPILFQKDSQAKFLLMRLRNEAHRFANALREKKGHKAAIHSMLDDVPGIGPILRTKLLKRFGSVDAMRAASDKELREILTEEQQKSLRAHL